MKMIGNFRTLLTKFLPSSTSVLVPVHVTVTIKFVLMCLQVALELRTESKDQVRLINDSVWILAP